MSARRKLPALVLLVVALCAGALAYGHSTRTKNCIPGVGVSYGPPVHGDWITSDWRVVPADAVPAAVPC